MPPELVTVTLLGEVPHSSLWLLRARIGAFVSFFILVVEFAILGLSEGPQQSLLYLAVLVPFWLPYLWMFFRLRGKTVKSVKIGLAMAVACGSFGTLLTLFFAALSSVSHFDWVVFAGIVFIVTQIFLVISGIAGYYSIPRTSGDFRILAERVVLFGAMCLLIIIGSIVPSMLHNKVAADESLAIASLRTINSAQMSYGEGNPTKGFASSLAELGPPPGDNQIDVALASGTKSGYVFIFTVGPHDSSGRITKYTVTARPQVFGNTGNRSFFTDESFIIRSTAENRLAIASDLPLQ
jgi:hypothetical protein